MLVRRSEMRASKIMQQRVLNNPNIEVLFNHETLEILGDHEVNGMRLKDHSNGEEKVIAVSGFFVAIGHQPNTDIFKGWIDMDESGYIMTKPGTTQTNIEGVFAAGDAQDKVYRQAVTAAGTGCMAALEAERFLAAHE
jgi:thioredoxin reductase (NADPH)